MDVKRVIHMNMKTHPKDAKRTSLGHSIGRWDGDTLVIESANFPAGVLNRYVEQAGQPTKGLPHSTALASSNGSGSMPPASAWWLKSTWGTRSTSHSPFRAPRWNTP
jgi:hypothetical protein